MLKIVKYCIVIVSLLVLIKCVKASYEVRYEGYVFTKHGYKVPNRVVYIFQSINESNTKKIGSGITDADGHFDFQTKANRKNTCYISIAPGDSGYTDRFNVNNRGQTGLQIYFTIQ